MRETRERFSCANGRYMIVPVGDRDAFDFFAKIKDLDNELRALDAKALDLLTRKPNSLDELVALGTEAIRLQHQIKDKLDLFERVKQAKSAFYETGDIRHLEIAGFKGYSAHLASIMC